MRRQTDFTPDTTAQVRCALDMLRTALCAHPDIDALVDATTDWGDDVANSDAPDTQKAQCEALAVAAGAMFRLLDARDAGNATLIIADGDMQATFEWPAAATEDPHPEFVATVESAVREALGQGAHA